MQGLTVAGTLDALEAIARYIKAVADRAGLDRQTAYNLRLAVDEVTTNIILHGYKEAGIEGQLHLCASIEADSLTISVEDTGMTYNPQSMQAKALHSVQQPPELRSIGGLGIFLAIASVDRFTYEQVNGFNRTILSVNIASSQ
ncbi:ATP-binding protein [Spirulina sp. 06S082]|uniref:ATP-binding protein n=1 Tax=Spirulina sp. 06S082 TaxID=3110248 RepID=UPI002B21B1D4|nr:ATP-binding protein [Spirulina sp. 06S082]MEA5467473.1 ATP-binding protein [Spirulina sp. 06S082]